MLHVKQLATSTSIFSCTYVYRAIGKSHVKPKQDFSCEFSIFSSQSPRSICFELIFSRKSDWVYSHHSPICFTGLMHAPKIDRIPGFTQSKIFSLHWLSTKERPIEWYKAYNSIHTCICKLLFIINLCTDYCKKTILLFRLKYVHIYIIIGIRKQEAHSNTNT